MKTIPRNRLAARVRRGELEARASFSYVDDGYPQRALDAGWKPARIMEGDGDCREGFYNLFESDFTGHGRAYISDPTAEHEVITLRVHSNYVVTLRPRSARAVT